MAKVILTKLGNLFLQHPYKKKRTNVTGRAINYLFEPVEMGERVTFKSIFLLLKKNPALCTVFERYQANAQIQLALNKKLYDRSQNDYEQTPDDWFELSKVIETDEYDNLVLLPKLSFGLHAPPNAEMIANGVIPDKLIEYSVTATSSMYPYRNVPIRLVPLRIRVSSKQSDITDQCTNRFIAKSNKNLDLDSPLLGEFLESILYNLSFWGIGELSAEMKEIVSCTDFEDS